MIREEMTRADSAGKNDQRVVLQCIACIDNAVNATGSAQMCKWHPNVKGMKVKACPPNTLAH